MLLCSRSSSAGCKVVRHVVSERNGQRAFGESASEGAGDGTSGVSSKWAVNAMEFLSAALCMV